MKWKWKLTGIDGIKNEGEAETTYQAFEDARDTEVRNMCGEVDKIKEGEIRNIKIWREE